MVKFQVKCEVLHRQYLNFIAQTVFEFYCTDMYLNFIAQTVF